MKNENQFLLDIRYHQHQSWQGTVQRLDTGEIISFRSALELLTLLESVVARSEGSAENQRMRQWQKTESTTRKANIG